MYMQNTKLSNSSQAAIPAPELSSPHHNRGLFLFALFCLLLPVLFIWLHLITPSDEARLSSGLIIYTDQGVVVSPYESGQGLLQEGDVISAVDGVPMQVWLRSLGLPGSSGLSLQPGQTILYTVLRKGELLDLKIPLGTLPLAAILREHWSVILFFMVSQVVAGFVYLRRPEDLSARAFFIWAFSGSHTYTWAFFLQISDLLNPVGFWLFHLAATGLWLVFWASVVHMVFVFPKPLVHLHHPRRWLVLLYLSSFIFFSLYLLWQWQLTSSLSGWLDSWSTGQTLVAAIFTLPSLVLIVIQYFTSRSEIERLKTRWVIFGTLISLGLGLVLYFIPSLLGRTPIRPTTLGLINFPFIITMGIAIWRYQLFDIDLIIRRTLQYALLTGLLSLIYFSVVALLQALISALGGQPSAVMIVITTLLIAALFNPLRLRIQAFIDRRFYRRKYDAEKALAEFTASARSETDLEHLSEQLIRTVQETIQPDKADLWLIKNETAEKRLFS